MTFDFRIFEYSRKDKDSGAVIFFAQMVFKGYDLVCYSDCKLPNDISEDTAMEFFNEAEAAALKKIDEEYISSMGG